MGGGGAMRAAGRVASYGVSSGLRGTVFPLHKEQQQQQSTVSTQGQQLPIRVAPISVCSNNSTVSISSNENRKVDDWEFVDGDIDIDIDHHPLPRLVFPGGGGGVPSFQEAEEATSDLKHALEREYFSNSVSSNTSSISQESTLLRSGHSETKACITSESALVHSVPKPIFQAFSMLTKSPEAQGVVASLASDKNVWDAVMQNEKVMEFIKKQQNVTVSEFDTNTQNPFPESEYFEDLKSSEDESSEEESRVNSGEAGNKFMEFIKEVKITVTDMVIKEVKITVTDMVNTLSGFFQNIFGSPTEEKISIDPNGNATVTAGLGASFMALAVLAIMVAVLKRG